MLHTQQEELTGSACAAQVERRGTEEKTDDEETKMVDEEERRALAAWRGWKTAALVIALVALAGAVAHFVAGCQ